MKHQDINALIDRYYESSLTIEEEKYLDDYLKNNDASEYDVIKLQKSSMDKLFDGEEMLDQLFDEKLLDTLNSGKFIKQKNYHIKQIISGIAAIALIIISIWIVTNVLSTKEVYGTISDPIIAFAETKKALQKVSSNVKKAVTPAAKSMKKVETGLENTKKVEKATNAIKDIDKINRLNDTGELLKSLTKVTVKAGKS